MSTFKALDTDKIIQTVAKLNHRISERFPESGLSGVCAQLLDIAHHSKERTEAIQKPIIWVRALNIFLIVIIVLTLMGAAARFRLSVDDLHFLTLYKRLRQA